MVDRCGESRRRPALRRELGDAQLELAWLRHELAEHPYWPVLLHSHKGHLFECLFWRVDERDRPDGTSLDPELEKRVEVISRNASHRGGAYAVMGPRPADAPAAVASIPLQEEAMLLSVDEDLAALRLDMAAVQVRARAQELKVENLSREVPYFLFSVSHLMFLFYFSFRGRTYFAL